MNKCYEFFLLQESVRESDGTISSSRLSIEVHPGAVDEIDAVLQKHGRNSWEFFGKLDISFRQIDMWPWAIVLFDDEFKLGGHLVSIRQSKDDFTFSAYSLDSSYSAATDGPPPVSALFINRKDVLEELSAKTELVKLAWDQLSDRPEHQHWVCISESPEKEWVEKVSQSDDQLFLEITGS